MKHSSFEGEAFIETSWRLFALSSIIGNHGMMKGLTGGCQTCRLLIPIAGNCIGRLLLGGLRLEKTFPDNGCARDDDTSS